MVEVVFVDEVDGQRGVIGVGRLVIGLTQGLERVRQLLQATDQFVRSEVFRNLEGEIFGSKLKSFGVMADLWRLHGHPSYDDALRKLLAIVLRNR